MPDRLLRSLRLRPFHGSFLLAALLLGQIAQGAPSGTSAPDAALHQAYSSNGVYVSKQSGAKHPWQVTEAHSLMWDNRPYLPVGAAFAPRSLQSDAPAAWDQDRASLDAMKAHGVQDLLIQPARSLPDVPTASLQRLIDYLNANQFHFGLAFGPGIETPVAGFVVRPSVYRFEDPRQLTATWQVSDTDAAAYFLADAGRNSLMLHSGMATVREGVATAPLDASANSARPVALLIPRETPRATQDAALPDLWGRFDTYRDHLLIALAQIKFGEGLRFFLDPLAHHLSLSEETSYLIPDSDAFRLEWETFLTRRYSGPEEIQEKWKLTETPGSISALTHLAPLWSRDRGFPYLFDPTTGKIYHTEQSETVHSLWWDDFTEFRTSSINYFMNSIADLLKHRVADVPVIYTSLPGNRAILQSDPAGGFDGLAISTRVGDPSRLAQTSGPVFSIADHALRRTWLLASEIETASADPTAAAGKTTDNDHRNALTADLMSMRRIGFKGFYIADHSANAAAAPSPSDWLAQSANLDWMHSYTAGYSGDPAAARYLPSTLYYPQSAPGPAHTGLTPGSTEVYWLPSNLPGAPIDQWPTLAGYTIAKTETETDTVLLSLQGPRKIRFMATNADKILASTPEGQPVPIKKIGKTGFEVTFGNEPIIFQTYGKELNAVQSAYDMLVQLGYLVKHSQDDKAQSADYGKLQLDEASQFYNSRNYGASYAAARSAIDKLAYDEAPYIWLEGEAPLVHNFTEVAPNSEASNFAFLRLSTPNRPLKISLYGVRYVLNVTTDDRYDIWIAATPPGPEVSPISWYLDNQTPQDSANLHPQGPLYLSDRFGWMKLGSLQITKGQHAFSIKVLDRASATHLYSFSIDALLFIPSSRSFQPNGSIRPILVDPQLAIKAFKASLKAAP